MEQMRLDGIADVITDIRETVAAATSEKDEKVKKQVRLKIRYNLKRTNNHRTHYHYDSSNRMISMDIACLYNSRENMPI